MKSFVFVVVVIFSLPSAPAFGQWTWTIQNISPNQSSTDATNPNAASGGRVNGLGRAANGKTFFAASEWGGIFKSTDTGNNWSHLSGHVPTATWDVEVDPSNASRVYATSFYDGKVNSLAGINVSQDGGATWKKPATATPPTGFCIDTARRSEPAAFGIAIDPANFAHVFVGTNCGLARSNDSGATWTFIDPTPLDGADDVWDVIVHNGGIIDICGDDGHQRSVDGGTTWTSAATVPLPAGRCSITVSPDESGVLLVVTGTSVRESDDGGSNWSAPFANPGPQGRIPFVAVNKRSGAVFDLYFGDTQLWRASCTTPATPNNNLRCPTNSWTTVQTGSHWDVGDIAFAPGVAQDACPVLFSNDGGIYRNTLNSSPGCHTPNWEQPTTSTHALWTFGMAGADQAGIDAEDLYFGAQDDGTFATIDAPITSPTWVNPDCCDAHDVAAEGNRVLYTVCCWSGGRSNRLFVRNQGMTGGAEINTYPAGNVRSFSQSDSIAQFATNSYVVLTTNGAFVTSNVGASPVVWTQLGAATSPANARQVQVAVTGGTPTFYVLGGQANGRSQDALFRYVGIASGSNWTRINPPGNVGGFGLFAVDRSNPNRLLASHLRTGQAPSMIRSNDGGTTWNAMSNLDAMMTGNGMFQYANTRGPSSGLPATAAMGFFGYPQPSLLTFDPQDTNVLAAGGQDSGVFISFNNGADWTLLTDPNTPGTSGRAHIPRPWYAYFDHEGGTLLTPRITLYIGTQGQGAWRISLKRRLIVVDICRRFPGVCRPPEFGKDLLHIRCLGIKGCIVRDPLPKNCLLKYNCPGCSPGGLCPPYYNLFFDKVDLKKWDVTLMTLGGDIPKHEVFATKDGVVLSFRPDRSLYEAGKIGNYQVVFSLREGHKGENIEIPARLEISDRIFSPQKE